jgi:hypothetical protein
VLLRIEKNLSSGTSSPLSDDRTILTIEGEETIMEPLRSIQRDAMATTITLKKIPSGLYESLKESASLHRRSLNGEIIALLEEKFQAGRRRPEDFLASARALRGTLKGVWLTEAIMTRAKKEGRP